MLSVLFSVACIHLIALASPGPDFFFVSQTAISKSRKVAICGVVGITLGVSVWTGFSLLGLQIIFEKFGWLQNTIMFLGGLYLCYLGFLLLSKAFRKKTETRSHEINNPSSAIKSFLFGLLTNLSNPKAAVYSGSVLSFFISVDMEAGEKLSVFMLISVETFLWFSAVAMLFGLPSLKRSYLKASRIIDSLSGTVMSGLGLGLIYKAVEPA